MRGRLFPPRADVFLLIAPSLCPRAFLPRVGDSQAAALEAAGAACSAGLRTPSGVLLTRPPKGFQFFLLLVYRTPLPQSVVMSDSATAGAGAAHAPKKRASLSPRGSRELRGKETRGRSKG